jgi:hypothetical protein
MDFVSHRELYLKNSGTALMFFGSVENLIQVHFRLTEDTVLRINIIKLFSGFLNKNNFCLNDTKNLNTTGFGQLLNQIIN